MLGTEEKNGPLQTIQKILPFWWKKMAHFRQIMRFFSPEFAIFRP
jgi:hypothetical protein